MAENLVHRHIHLLRDLQRRTQESGENSRMNQKSKRNCEFFCLFFLVSLKPIDAELYRGSSKRQMCSEPEEDGKQNAVGNEGREDSERGQ